MDQHRLQELIGSDYTLIKVIGNGGMSTVWLAQDNVAGREVAIKVLRPEFSDNQEFLSRFRNEAATAQHINSPNVVSTYDYREGTDHHGAHFCFMALELVRGESLADLLARESALPARRALDILEQAAQGLSVIHAMGMVHRDIKPGNLLISTDGQVKITDFGIAKAAAAVPLTRTGMVVGTAHYVSPEQAQGIEVTAASDVYSLGVVGYEMLTGRRPFAGDSTVSVALAHISQEAPPLPAEISPAVRQLIEVAMRKDPQSRYANGEEFVRAIDGSRRGKVSDVPTTMVPAVKPVKKSSGVAWWLVPLLLLAVGAVAVTGWYVSQQPEVPAAPSEVPIVTEYVDGGTPEVVPAVPARASEVATRVTVTETASAENAPATTTEPETLVEEPTTPELTPENTPVSTNAQPTEVSPLDSLSVNPTHFATNPTVTL